jgi:putative two-component system response regulator
MDGTGYPDGLRGEQIPLQSRVLQIADIYDALTIHRPYRIALSPEEALQILHQEAARGWLDASLVSQFSGIRRSGEPLRESRSMLASYYGMPQPVAFF